MSDVELRKDVGGELVGFTEPVEGVMGRRRPLAGPAEHSDGPQHPARRCRSLSQEGVANIEHGRNAITAEARTAA